MTETPEQTVEPRPGPGPTAGDSPAPAEAGVCAAGPSCVRDADNNRWLSPLVKRTRAGGPACAWTLLWGAIAAYCAVVGTYVVLFHNSFQSGAFDLGIFDQALWLVSHGHEPFVTVRGLHRFGDHIEFILYALSPAYWIWDDVRCMLLLQTAVLALGALPVFLLARKSLGHAVALCFALAYLISPSVQNLNLDHVHAEAFGSTALLFAFYFASERRFGLMLALCGAAMLCKEDVAITTGAFGLLVAWRWNKKAGFVLLLGSIVWFVLCMKVFLPMFNETGFFRFQSGGWFSGWNDNRWNLKWYWGAFVHDPYAPGNNWPGAMYLLQLLGPLAFLSLLSPLTALVAAPAIIINLLTRTDYMRLIGFHYMTSITPFLFAAAIEGAARVASGSRRILMVPFLRMRRRGNVVLISPGVRLYGPALPAWVLQSVVVALVLGAAYWGNLKWSNLPLRRTAEKLGAADKLKEVYDYSRTGSRCLAINAAMQRIPADAVVSADYQILPHLSHRKGIYMFPNPFFPESWGINDRNTHDPNIIQYIIAQDGLLNPAKRNLISGLLKKGQFREEFNGSGVHLYKRVSAAAEPVIIRPATGHGLTGVFYSFDTSLPTIPDWRRREPVFQALFPTIDFPPTDGELISAQEIRTGMRSRFLAVFEGFLMAPEAGEYVFAVSSDDGFRLSLSGRRVSECDKLRAFEETRSKAVRLPQGLTPIQLLYFDNEPAHGLRLEWQLPGRGFMEVIPEEFLYPTREAAASAAQPGQPDAGRTQP